VAGAKVPGNGSTIFVLTAKAQDRERKASKMPIRKIQPIARFNPDSARQKPKRRAPVIDPGEFKIMLQEFMKRDGK